MAFEFTVYLCGLCGVLMVAGAIWLLHSGVIKLSEAGKSGGFSVEVEKRIKIATRYPALALFLIGLLFVALALWFSKPTTILPVNLVGKLALPGSPKITIRVSPEDWGGFQVDSNGEITKTLNLDFRQVRVEIEAEGYAPRPFAITRAFEKRRREIVLPENLTFTRIPADHQAPTAGTISPLPSGVALAPFQPPPTSP